jgi:hypothetical protein
VFVIHLFIIITQVINEGHRLPCLRPDVASRKTFTLSVEIIYALLNKHSVRLMSSSVILMCVGNSSFIVIAV